MMIEENNETSSGGEMSDDGLDVADPARLSSEISYTRTDLTA